MARGGKRPGAGRKIGTASIEAEKARILIATKLVKELGPIVDKAILQAKDGDKAAREWLSDRGLGKVPTTLALPTDEGALTISWGSHG